MCFQEHKNLRLKIAQLLVIRASAHLYDTQREYPQWELTNCQLQKYLGQGVGGVVLFGGTSKELTLRCENLKRWARYPLLLCADIEEGLGQRFNGGTWLLPPIAISQLFEVDPDRAIKFAERYGICIGKQARCCGLNWVLAPVCDVNTNPLNPVINVRAWGEDSDVVSTLACAFHRGLDSQGVLSCAKHFPGHGDTEDDSHLDLPQLDHNLTRLQSVELVPFQAAIAAGVSSVMTGHLLLSNIDSSRPATLSKKVVTQLLRKQLGFDGLVVTDALLMQAISKQYGSGEAAVLAFEAGADLILMPANINDAINALVDAFCSGRIPLKRLDESLHRREVAVAKIQNKPIQTYQNKFDDIEEIESQEDHSFANELIEISLKIHNPGPIRPCSFGVNLIRIDGVLPCSILTHNSPAIIAPEEAGFKTVIYHQNGVSPWQKDEISPLALDRLGKGPVLLQLFARGNPFCGNSYVKEPWLAALKQLQKMQILAGLVVYGSPYLWDQLRDELENKIPAAYTPGQMPLAQSHVLASLLPDSQEYKLIDSLSNKEFTN